MNSNYSCNTQLNGSKNNDSNFNNKKPVSVLANRSQQISDFMINSVYIFKKAGSRKQYIENCMESILTSAVCMSLSRLKEGKLKEQVVVVAVRGVNPGALGSRYPRFWGGRF